MPARVIVIAIAIIVFLEAQDASTPLAAALTRATEQALGARASISAQPLPAELAEGALGERGRAEGASFVARISWKDPARLDARMEVIEIETGRAETRRVVFQPSDDPAERGRTLGLLLASVIDPAAGGGAKRTPPEPPPPPQPRSPEPTTIAAAPPQPQASVAWAADAAAEGAFAVGGAGTGVGGAVGIRWSPWRRVALRAGGRARFGNVAAAQASSLSLGLSAGVIVSVTAADTGRRLGLAVRADALLLFESLTHLSADDPEPVRQGRLIPGTSFLVEGQLSLGPSVRLILAAGPEIAFGRTDVYVGANRVAQLPPTRLVVEGGLVARF